MNIVGKKDIEEILGVPLFVMWRGFVDPEEPNVHKAWFGMVKAWSAEDLFQTVDQFGDPYQAEFSVAPEHFGFVVEYNHFKDCPDASGVNQSQRPELCEWTFGEVYDVIDGIAQGKPTKVEKHWFEIDWKEVREK